MTRITFGIAYFGMPAASDAGSEDLEQDSSDDEDEDEEEVGGDSEGDEDMEMGEGEGKPAQTNGETKLPQGQQQPEVTVH
jgi:histone chaperone ASF1